MQSRKQQEKARGKGVWEGRAEYARSVTNAVEPFACVDCSIVSDHDAEARREASTELALVPCPTGL